MILDSNKFLKLNNTYYGELVGKVRNNGDKTVSTVLNLVVRVPWVKPSSTDFSAKAADLAKQRADAAAAAAQKKKE